MVPLFSYSSLKLIQLYSEGFLKIDSAYRAAWPETRPPVPRAHITKFFFCLEACVASIAPHASFTLVIKPISSRIHKLGRVPLAASGLSLKVLCRNKEPVREVYSLLGASDPV